MANGQLIAKKLPQQPEAKHETPIGIAYANVPFILVNFGISEFTITHGL